MSGELAWSLMNMMNKFFQFRKTNYSVMMLNSEFHILSMVSHGENGMTISDIAGKLNVSIPSVSRSVKSLVEKGLLKRYYDPNDRRTTYVMLTDKGFTSYNHVKENLDDFVSKIISKYDKEDIEAFIELGNKLAEDFLLLAPEYEKKIEEINLDEKDLS